jgi:hypothetical protein
MKLVQMGVNERFVKKLDESQRRDLLKALLYLRERSKDEFRNPNSN